MKYIFRSTSYKMGIIKDQSFRDHVNTRKLLQNAWHMVGIQEIMPIFIRTHEQIKYIKENNNIEEPYTTASLLTRIMSTTQRWHIIHRWVPCTAQGHKTGCCCDAQKQWHEWCMCTHLSNTHDWYSLVLMKCVRIKCNVKWSANYEIHFQWPMTLQLGFCQWLKQNPVIMNVSPFSTLRAGMAG